MLHGRNDPLCPLAEARELADTLPSTRIELAVFEAGHFDLYESDPAGYDQRLKAFFAKLPPGADRSSMNLTP